MNARLLCILLCYVVVAAHGQGESSKAARILPSASELPGWKEVQGSFVYGAGESLTAIYDGGYMQYVNAGVLEAAQRLFKRDKTYLTITTHTMRSANAASSFLKHWENSHDNEKKERTPGTGRGFLVASGGAVHAYWVHGGYFVTVMVTGADSVAKKAAVSALATVAKKIPKARR